MAKLQKTLLGTSDPGCDGQREWRFIVNGPTRTFYTVKAVNREAAEAMLQTEIESSNQQLGEEATSGIVTLGVLGLLGLGAYKLAAWWKSKQVPVTKPADGE